MFEDVDWQNRISSYLLNINRVGETTAWEVIQAFIMGVRFDVVTIGFAIAISADDEWLLISKPSEEQIVL